MQHWLIYLASHLRVDARFLLSSDMVGWFLKESVPQKALWLILSNRVMISAWRDCC